VPRNMPGAGSLLVLNYIANSAPKDGTELAAVGREMPTAKLFGEKNAHFEAAELNWIGNTESAASFCGGIEPWRSTSAPRWSISRRVRICRSPSATTRRTVFEPTSMTPTIRRTW